jgi:very-short-patch-repair endonuclease
MVKVAKELRTKMTATEKILWQRLRNRQVNNLKFYRQFPFVFGEYNFIADFYCHDFKLIIEIDGGIHQDREVKECDRLREDIFKQAGYKVVRFSNKEVLESIDNVINKIIEITKR